MARHSVVALHLSQKHWCQPFHLNPEYISQNSQEDIIFIKKIKKIKNYDTSHFQHLPFTEAELKDCCPIYLHKTQRYVIVQTATT